MAKVEERMVSIFQCDECNYEGESLSIKQCRICAKDLCPIHITRIIISYSKEASQIVGFFCESHGYFVLNELTNLIGGEVVSYKQEDLSSYGSEEPKVKFWEVPTK